MRRYFKTIDADGKPGLCVITAGEEEIKSAVEALKLVGESATEIDAKEARKVRAEIARYEERRWKAERAKVRAQGREGES